MKVTWKFRKKTKWKRISKLYLHALLKNTFWLQIILFLTWAVIYCKNFFQDNTKKKTIVSLFVTEEYNLSIMAFKILSVIKKVVKNMNK